MSNKKSDLIAGIVLALFAGWYFFEASGIRVMKAFSKASVNSSTMPKIYAVCLLLLALCLIVRGVRANKAKGSKASDETAKGSFFKNNLETIQTFFALFLYILLMEPFGFVISSIVYVFAQTLILMPRKTKSGIVKAGIIAVVCSVATYYVFVNWLAVLLPAGNIF